MREINDTVFLISFLALIGSIIAFWFSYTYPQAMNENMGVLLVFARRFTEGGIIGIDIYETNPPLSILIYVPVIWIQDFTGLDIHDASFLYISLCLAFSTLLLTLLLKTQKNQPYETLLIVSAFLLSQFFVTVNDYGEREQFVSLGLTPLCFLIYFKTKKNDIPLPLTVLTTIFGTGLALIKPHFGLLIAALFLHRAWVNRNLFSPIKNLDFILAVLVTCVYFFSLVTSFKIFTFDSLPDILTLYVSQILHTGILLYLPFIYSILILIFMGLTWVNERITHKTDLLYFLGAMTLLSLVAFMAQTKGLFYQLIPSSSLFLMTLSLYCFYTLTPFITLKRALFLSVIACIIVPLMTFYALNFRFPNRETIKELPFAQWFKDYCPKDRQCSAYIFHESVDGIFSSFHYTDTLYASRFASHWFLPKMRSIIESKKRNPSLKTPISLDKALHLEEKFAQFVGEDFHRFKPDFVALIRTQFSADPSDSDADLIDFDFVAHYSNNPLFKTEWKNYHYVGAETVNRRFYFKGTSLDSTHLMVYDLYVRHQK